MREILRVPTTLGGSPYHRVVVTESGSIGLLDHNYRDACRQMTLFEFGDATVPCPCILAFFKVKIALSRITNNRPVVSRNSWFIPPCLPNIAEFIDSCQPVQLARNVSQSIDAHRKYRQWRRSRGPVDRLDKGTWRYLYGKMCTKNYIEQFTDCVFYECWRRGHRTTQEDSSVSCGTAFVNVLLKDLPHRQLSQKVYFYVGSHLVNFAVGNWQDSVRYIDPNDVSIRVREVLATTDVIEKMLFTASLNASPNSLLPYQEKT